MNTLETISNRRSVRSFADKPIPKETLLTLIKAGSLAPTGANAQPWRFVVITDQKTRADLATLALPRYKVWMEKYGQGMKEMREEYDSKLKDSIYYSAPAVVFVIGLGMTGDQDCPMACENIMLAARSLEIGSCWVYFGQLVLDDPKVRTLLELKEGEKVYGPIVLGYPKAGFPPSPPKKEPVIKWI